MTTFVVVIFPWSSSYRFVFSGFTLGDFLLILVIFVNLYSFKGRFVYNNKKLNNSYRVLALYIIYALFITLISLMKGDFVNYVNVMKRSVKMILYFGAIIFIIPNSFNYDYFIKIYKRVVYISCVAIIIQYLGYYLGGVYIDFKIPFLSYSSIAAENFNLAGSRLMNFRPDSIFLEPSYFAYYVIGYLPIVLFNELGKVINILEGIFISLLLLMGKSSTAILLLIFIWSFYLIKLLEYKEISFSRKNKIFFILFFLLSFVGLILVNTDLFVSIQRMSFSYNDALASSVWSKLSGGRIFVNQLSSSQKLFGVGLGNYFKPIFTTSINFIIYSTGYIGFLIMFIWVVNSYFKSNNVGKVMTVLSLLLFISWYLIYSTVFILYCSLIIYNKKDSKSTKLIL
jgi:hypothetical protein